MISVRTVGLCVYINRLDAGTNMSKKLTYLLLGVSVAVWPGVAQVARRSVSSARAARAAGGRVSASLEPRETPVSLDMLIHMSLLIVDGTVSDVLPAVHVGTDPDTPTVETYSRILVHEVLSAVAVPKPASLFVVQEGGKAGKWDVVTPDVPLLQKGERYIFFLDPDQREPAYEPGTPRFNAVGVWSGLVRVQDDRVGFLPRAVPALHDSDNMSASGFLALVRRRVEAVVPKDQIILDHPIHVPQQELSRAQKAAGEAK